MLNWLRRRRSDSDTPSWVIGSAARELVPMYSFVSRGDLDTAEQQDKAEQSMAELRQRYASIEPRALRDEVFSLIRGNEEEIKKARMYFAERKLRDELIARARAHA